MHIGQCYLANIHLKIITVRIVLFCFLLVQTVRIHKHSLTVTHELLMYHHNKSKTKLYILKT